MLKCKARPATAGARPSRRSAVRVAASVSASRRDLLLGAAGAAAASYLWLPGSALAAPAPSPAAADSIYQFSALQYGKERSLADYRGKVVAGHLETQSAEVTAAASSGGWLTLTVLCCAALARRQKVNYPGLRTLYDKYNAAGFDLICFPCNQFGGQAPGTSQEEREWAWKKFGLEFGGVFDHVDVNGPDAAPLYSFLKDRLPLSIPSDVRSRPNGDIEWNYAKFLVDARGVPVKRYKPSFDPLNMETDVQLVLAGREPQPAECVLHPGRKVCKLPPELQPAQPQPAA
ncbi:hypothetical protein HXX76_014530 [Chlamydomonas incerta]|uniref:Glutathione peroxidase n=1 Tax=Chlamydomonas incerta TaxID=51695 RepID=A0A835SBZ7_CHLIN|nr:hypothetical protein HXX76_014530 [Chlamydomonas incerta]|eukprot:KAG2424478.1 hypothetical protein HXX76_014530 [Chlamydomonas incerta]